MRRIFIVFLLFSQLLQAQKEEQFSLEGENFYFYYPNHFEIAPNKNYKAIRKSFLDYYSIKHDFQPILFIDTFNQDGRKIKTQKKYPNNNGRPCPISYDYDVCGNIIAKIKNCNGKYITNDTLLYEYTYDKNCRVLSRMSYRNYNSSNWYRYYFERDTLYYGHHTDSSKVIERNKYWVNVGRLYDYSNQRLVFLDKGIIQKAITLTPAFEDYVDSVIVNYTYEGTLLKRKETATIVWRYVTDTEIKRYKTTYKTRYIYDDHGRLIKEIDDSDKILFRFNQVNQIVRIRHISRSFLWRLLGNVDFIETYSYRDDDNLESIIRKDYGGLFGLKKYKSELRLEYINN